MRRASASQEYSPLGESARAGGERGARVLVAEQLAQRVAQRDGVARGERARGAGGSDLGEAANVAEQQRLAERERREQHARLVDLAVGQHHHVGAAEVRGQLVIADEARHEAHARRGAGA